MWRLATLALMTMCVYLLFDAPSAVFTPPTQRQASGQFRGTRGSAETWLLAAEKALVPKRKRERIYHRYSDRYSHSQ